jgi:hypothetical protein
MSYGMFIKREIFQQAREHLERFGFENVTDGELMVIFRRVIVRSYEESSWLTYELRRLRAPEE